MIRRAFLRLHRDEGGQVLWFFAMVALSLVMLVALVFNTGLHINRKVEMQNAADAAAVSGAMWIARGMNVISMNNVAMTESLALIVNLKAMVITAEINTPILEAEEKIAAAMLTNPFTAVPGAILMAGVVVGKIANGAVVLLKGTIEGTVIPGLWRFMGMLDNTNRLMTAAAPALAGAQSINVGTRNISQRDNTDFALLMPNIGGGNAFYGCSGQVPYALPVARGRFSDLCDPTKRGTHSDSPVNIRGYTPLLEYQRGDGPFEYYKKKLKIYWYAVVVTGSPFWWGSVGDLVFATYCHGEAAPVSIPPIERMVNDLSEAERQNASKYVWQWSYVSTRPMRQSDVRQYVEDPSADLLPKPKERPDFQKFYEELSRRGWSQDKIQDEILRQTQQSNDSTPVLTDPVVDFQSATEMQRRGFQKTNCMPSHYSIRPPCDWVKKADDWVWNHKRITPADPNDSHWPRGERPPMYKVEQERWRFLYGVVTVNIEQEIRAKLPAGDGQNVAPYYFSLCGKKLDDPADLPRAVKRLQYLAVARRGSSGKPWFGNMKVSVEGETNKVFEPPGGIFTYAQAQVYNPTSWDMFTQNWRVRLVPASLLEEEVGTAGLFEPLFRAVRPLARSLNAH